MKRLEAWSERIRRNQPIPTPVAGLLECAALVQRFGMWLRLRRTLVRVPARVVSFGNLTAGGTGKTPAVIERAEKEVKAGRKVAILTRGYGAVRTRRPLVLPPGKGECADTGLFGDEAALIVRRVPGVWIVRCPDRVVAARAAIAHGCDLLILDDGFQAVRLARDENILLIDATNPFGNGRLVPRGMLREPLTAIKRATEVRITRCDQAPEALDAIETVVQRIAPGVPLGHYRHRPESLRCLADGEEAPLARLSGAPVRVVCGIGNPDAFVNTLEALGADVEEVHAVSDHGPIPETLLTGELMTIVTEKDAVRIGPCANPGVYSLAVALAPYRFTEARSASR